MLQNLVRERVSTRALPTILEAIADGNPRSKAPEVLSEDTCQHLAPPIGVRRPPCQSLRRRTGLALHHHFYSAPFEPPSRKHCGSCM